MTISEQKQRERDEGRRLICDKTKELILEQGLNGFSMRDVARGRGFSRRGGRVGCPVRAPVGMAPPERFGRISAESFVIGA